MYSNPHNRDKIRARLHEKIVNECAGLGIYKLSPAARAVLDSELNALMQKPSITEAELKKIAIKSRQAHYTETNTGPRKGTSTGSRPATSCSMRPPTGVAGLRPSTPSPMRGDMDYSKVPAKMRATGVPLGPIFKKKFYERLADSEWEDKLDHELEILQKDKYDEQQMKNDQQAMMKQSLDAQVTLMEKFRSEQRAKDDAFSRAEQQRKQEWDEEQKQEDITRWANRNKERENLKQQIRTREEEKRLAELQRKSEEEAYAQTIADEHATRKMEEQKKRQKEYAEIQNFLDYNAQMSDKKKRDKLHEVEMEKKYLADYAAYLEKKEQEYRDNLARITSNQTKRVQHAAGTYYKSLWDMEQRDAEKAEKEQQELQERLMADEAARKERIRAENQMMKDTLHQQVSEKQRIRQEEMAEARRMRHQLEELIKEEQEEVAKGRSKRQQQQIARARELDDQVARFEKKQRSPMEIKIGSREAMYNTLYNTASSPLV